MINLLLIDDSEDELFLLEDELVQGGLSPALQRVDNEQDMKIALASATEWDIALVDYVMPHFSAQEALQILKNNNKDIPAIVVSGQVSEEIAVMVMRLGARDYISKHNRYRLIPSIQREIDNHNRRKEQRQFKKQLRQTEQKLAAVAKAAHDAIILVKDDYSIEFWNSAAQSMFGYSRKEVISKDINEILIPKRYKKQVYRIFRKFAASGKFTLKKNTIEIFLLQKSQKELPVEVSLSSVNIDNSWIAIAIIRDISERRDMEKKLRQLATHDTLTGLVNRREIMHHLKHEMARFYRYHTPVTLFFIDIDNFKTINDDYGHHIGDQTLVQCAHTMHSLMRKSDIIGRYGGEEFLLILPETTIKMAFELAERLRKYIDLNSANPEKKIPHYTISIGIAELGDKQITIDAFINLADKAMYQAKQMGRNKICVNAVEKLL